MLRYFVRQKWSVLIFVVLIIADPLLTARLNFMARDLFDSVGLGSPMDTILTILTFIFILWVLKRVLTFFISVTRAYIMKNLKIDLKYRSFRGVMKQDVSDFSHKDSGDYISLLTNDVNILENMYFSRIINLMFDVSRIVILGASFFVLERTIATAIFVVGIIAMIIPLVFQKYTSEKNLKYSQTLSVFTQKIKEFFIAYPTIKNYAVENEIISKFDDENTTVEETKFEADYALALANAFGAFFAWFMQFVAVGVGIFLVMDGRTTIGTVIAAQAFASDMGLPLQTFVQQLNSIRSVRAIVKKMKAFSESDFNSQAHGQAENSQSGDLTFNNVNLKFNGTVIIENFSFKFESGKKYLVIGRNGAGKSSLFKLIKKSFNGYSGEIRLGDVDIRSMSSDQISQQVSYLRENVSLLSGMVKDNITLYRTCDDGDIEKAIKQAQVNIDVQRNVQGDGLNISSGEQRRIEIARSLLNSANVLVFDEVVSTLDIETAYEIEKLALTLSEKTVIFVSHNFSGKLVKKYDEILLMQDGQLVAHGSYDELLESNAYFRRIFEIKMG